MGDINIQAKFEQYQKKYPLYTKDKIVDLMLDDGVITFDVAKKIKSGVSLFLIDNSLFEANSAQADFNMTNILGGNFNTSKKAPNTNFNRKIEPTFQPMTQGDCWLLSDINALNLTDWGRKAIEDAIIPDTDGSGGVTIRFKGSPLKQKDIHITAYEIEQARNSGNYVKEDDDVIAFELATEKIFREMVRQGLAERAETDEDMIRDGANYRSFIHAGVKTKEFEQYPISELLGIKVKVVDFMSINEQKTAKTDKEKIFKTLSENKNDVATTCSFAYIIGGWGDEKSKNYIHGGHAYSIKNLQYGKEVTLIDPHYSDFDIKVPWDVFMESVKDINVSLKNKNVQQKIENSLPHNYEENYKISMQNYENILKQFEQEHIARADSLEQERIEQQKIRENEIKQEQQKQLQKNQAVKAEVIKDLGNAMQTNDKDKFSAALRKLNKDIVVEVLNKYPNLISKCDEMFYGWGKGIQKKARISYIIDALSEKAKEKGVNLNIIAEFKSKCNDELNAILYTNEKVIITEVNKMKNLIENKK